MPAAASYPLVHTWSCISSPRLAHHQPDSHYQLLLPQAQMWQDPVAAKVHINSQGTQNCLWAWIQPCFLLLVHTTGLTCSELLQQCTCTPQPDFLHQPPLPGVRAWEEPTVARVHMNSQHPCSWKYACRCRRSLILVLAPTTLWVSTTSPDCYVGICSQNSQLSVCAQLVLATTAACHGP